MKVATVCHTSLGPLVTCWYKHGWKFGTPWCFYIICQCRCLNWSNCDFFFVDIWTVSISWISMSSVSNRLAALQMVFNWFQYQLVSVWTHKKEQRSNKSLLYLFSFFPGFYCYSPIFLILISSYQVFALQLWLQESSYNTHHIVQQEYLAIVERVHYSGVIYYLRETLGLHWHWTVISFFTFFVFLCNDWLSQVFCIISFVLIL